MARAPKSIDEYIRPFPPAVRGNPALQKAAAKYAGPKGNLRFPFDQPIPFGLIARITKHQVRQVRAKATAMRKRT